VSTSVLPIFEASYLHNGARWTHGDDGPFIVKRWWQIRWSRDWKCLLFSQNNTEGWKDYCCCTMWN